MKNDFLIYYRLENAYIVNHFIHMLHRLPLIKKLVEGKDYEAHDLKIIGAAYRFIREITISLIFKILYYGALFLISVLILSERYEELEGMPPIKELGVIFMTLFLFGTLIGGLFNNQLFNTDEHSYYAVSLLRVDARQYALVNYGYNLLKNFVFNFLIFIVFLFVFKLPVLTALLSAFYILAVKLSFQAIRIGLVHFFLTHSQAEAFTRIALFVVFIASGLGLAISGHELSYFFVTAILLLFIVLGILGCIRILSFKDFSNVYKKELSYSRITVDNRKAEAERKELKAANNSLSDKTINASSDKSGFAYLNELFMKRHHKSLWGTVRIQSIIIGAVVLAMSVLFIIFPEQTDGFSDLIITWIPSIMFLMYCLNRGQNFTTCLFVNCDHCFLTYPFFKEPKLILRLFTLRLWSLIKLNILPAFLIGTGLSWLYFLTGRSSALLDYFVLFVSPLAMAVFFSIHYMMLYYILQPFTIDSKVDSVGYKVINGATYIASYMMLQMKIGSFMFGIGTIIFCIIYSLIAILLVYKKAAKTFKIKQ